MSKNKKRTEQVLREEKNSYKILKLFLKKPSKALTYKQIFKRFEGKYPKSEIEEGIQVLLDNKKIIKVASNKLVLPVRNVQEMGLLKGTVDMNTSGNAYIVVEGRDNDIFVRSSRLNRSLDGDLVEVEVMPKRGRGRVEGKVSKVLERATKLFTGVVEKGPNYAFVITDKKNMFVDIFIPQDSYNNVEFENGDRVLVQIGSWPETHKSPLGKMLENLGKPGNNDTEMRSILLQFGFSLTFPEEVLDEVSAISSEITEADIASRRDFRKVTTFTIDPEDAKDFDDALSLKKLDNGNWEVGIHIADVSHYLKPDTALDKEAFKRATSVYLVDRVNPMLPEHLSNFLCSLRPNEDKCTFSAVFELSQDAKVLNQWFGRTLIHSDRRFAYEEVQEILDKGSGEYFEELNTLKQLARKLRKQKFAEGAIAFDTEEVRFKLNDDGVPIGLYIKERLEAHMLIEDFMLLANKKVASYVGKLRYGDNFVPFVYRVHDYPDMERLQEFAAFAHQFGHEIKFNSPQEVPGMLNKFFEEIKGLPEQNVLEQLAIRSMAKAVYTTDNIGHYGLAFDNYTHFTSPIRRYPDVLVHRILQQCLDKETSFPLKHLLEKQCVHCSEMERHAMNAEYESIRYKQVEYLQNSIGEEFDGIITGITAWGVFVEISQNKCEGMIRISEMDDNYSYEEGRYRLVSQSSGEILQLGDPIKIKIKDASLAKRTLDFQFIEKLK